ncbi:hypothetical protein PCASD_09327 [Puccinia coronata f. sp. avenae]|uniref:CxC1-like cysteine cluster associated with KDZ transposases domain-containing protein n=1 Tax=Puccinia coronata f. sp. avenae TaxID=200324 RepID=A0A2N5USI0_9BASI|nr:hypothetical protein PCASD_09327 [Puccinia coronata f. sp. avenae]
MKLNPKERDKRPLLRAINKEAMNQDAPDEPQLDEDEGNLEPEFGFSQHHLKDNNSEDLTALDGWDSIPWTVHPPQRFQPIDYLLTQEIRQHNRQHVATSQHIKWQQIMPKLFAVYLWTKEKTNNWTCTRESFASFVDVFCNCQPTDTKSRQWIDCVDIVAVIVYRDLLERTDNLVKSALGLQGQRLLALDCCPACFGCNLETGNQSNPKLNDRLIICLDGNFQQRHHQAAGKNFSPLITPNLLVQPGKLDEMQAYIDELEAIHKIPKTKKGANKCADSHKAADDTRNKTTWKGCDDTGLMGSCCRHDSVIYLMNIYESGKNQALALSILKRILDNINPNRESILQLGTWLCQKFLNALKRRDTAKNDLKKFFEMDNPYAEGHLKYSIQFLRAQWVKQTQCEGQRAEDNDLRMKQLAKFFKNEEVLKKAKEDIFGEGGRLSSSIDDWDRAVELQGEHYPIMGSQTVGTKMQQRILKAIKRRKNPVDKAIKNFNTRRLEYLLAHKPERARKKENKELTYKDLIKMDLNDPFWNDSFFFTLEIRGPSTHLSDMEYKQWSPKMLDISNNEIPAAIMSIPPPMPSKLHVLQSELQRCLKDHQQLVKEQHHENALNSIDNAMELLGFYNDPPDEVEGVRNEAQQLTDDEDDEEHVKGE